MSGPRDAAAGDEGQNYVPSPIHTEKRSGSTADLNSILENEEHPPLGNALWPICHKTVWLLGRTIIMLVLRPLSFCISLGTN